MQKGLVMEGGAMCGMFTAGVRDVLLENGIDFDGAIGVSAGATFGCNFKSKQIGRAIRYNKRFSHNWRYCSFKGSGSNFCIISRPSPIGIFTACSLKAGKKFPCAFLTSILLKEEL